VLLWSDLWLGNAVLQSFFGMFGISNEQQATVCQACDRVNLRITFRQSVFLEQFNRWLGLSQLVRTVVLTEVDDEPIQVVHSSPI
jgi:hypothetical protein